ncbi:GntR family transcriptional regulator [Ottowia testudinis]|uniref:GntR family transcriptional regulator n=1 Tax=Ottowia testudinis TaxID=2816950 RepID=A0A975H324_9BURK|nr:GntR family transcriptional regulator [Ottowia testudinis]QTD45379.1 GntR family transcriptional regulator [Ottowia testudinis]
MAKRALDPHTDAPERTLIERAYAQLRDDIVSGHLAPGEKLRVEHLKQHYGVGAGTLREAITRLASDALVVTEGQRGFRVAPMALCDMQDLTRLRIHIEIDALRQSMRHGDAAWRERLRTAYAELSRLEQPLQPEHARSWEALNIAFHEALLSGHDSPWTLRLLRTLSRQSERYRHYAIGLSDQRRDVHAEHQRIFDSAISGNELRAALALEEHIRTTAELVERALGGAAPEAAPPAA